MYCISKVHESVVTQGVPFVQLIQIRGDVIHKSASSFSHLISHRRHGEGASSPQHAWIYLKVMAFFSTKKRFGMTLRPDMSHVSVSFPISRRKRRC